MTRLKIDRGFVRNIPGDAEDLAIAKAIIALGKALSLDVLAEGVETDEQKNWLLQEGCHLGQGYWFSKPIPASATEDFLRNRKTN